MAFDGIVVSALVHELKSKIEGGKIAKIAQPEKDELILTIKHFKHSCKLMISANASLPLLHITEQSKQSPLTAPNFCMLLRKHIGNGKIIEISQPGLERSIEFTIEHLDELGDLCVKKLVVELMGKHSNIIFMKQDLTIIDSIKHVSSQVSSIREVLPARTYFLPQTVEKQDPLTITESKFIHCLQTSTMPLYNTLYQNLIGISPLISGEICHRSSLNPDQDPKELSSFEQIHLYRMFSLLMDDVKRGIFSPQIIYYQEEPIDFSATPLTHFESNDYVVKSFESISELLEFYYASKSVITRIKQKSVDLRKVVQTSLERNYKKYELQLKQLNDTKKRDKHKIYGELLNTYGYELQGGESSFTCINYYDGNEITIPLSQELSAKENAVKQFDKYNKLKRTFDALSQLILDTQKEIEHLESIATSLEIALKEEDLVEIKEELMEYGYLKRRYQNAKKPKITSKPFHFISSDGFHIYVGKNNYQNEEITFKLANGSDWWFHAKGVPGSHVIVKAEGKELPDKTFEEAASLAAFYSKNKGAKKVEVDYIQRKSLKRVSSGAPGFVVYHTNYSMIAEPKSKLNSL